MINWDLTSQEECDLGVIKARLVIRFLEHLVHRGL